MERFAKFKCYFRKTSKKFTHFTFSTTKRFFKGSFFQPPFFPLGVPTSSLSSLCSNLFPFCAPTLTFITLSFLSNNLFSSSFFVSPSFLSSVLHSLSFLLCYSHLPFLLSVFCSLSFNQRSNLFPFLSVFRRFPFLCSLLLPFMSVFPSLTFPICVPVSYLSSLWF